MDNCKYELNCNNIILSFKYSLKDKAHTIDKITKKSKQKSNDIIFELFKKFTEISSISWVELKNKPKEIAYETLPINQFNINFDYIKSVLNLSNDSKIIVFRFNNQKSRILGVQSRDCSSILYIIGYDWDYSAYNH